MRSASAKAVARKYSSFVIIEIVWGAGGQKNWRGFVYSGATIIEALAEVIASERRDFQAALEKRDCEIKALRRELGRLRTELEGAAEAQTRARRGTSRGRGVAQRAPTFESVLKAWPRRQRN